MDGWVEILGLSLSNDPWYHDREEAPYSLQSMVCTGWFITVLVLGHPKQSWFVPSTAAAVQAAFRVVWRPWPWQNPFEIQGHWALF